MAAPATFGEVRARGSMMATEEEDTPDSEAHNAEPAKPLQLEGVFDREAPEWSGFLFGADPPRSSSSHVPAGTLEAWSEATKVELAFRELRRFGQSADAADEQKLRALVRFLAQTATGGTETDWGLVRTMFSAALQAEDTRSARILDLVERAERLAERNGVQWAAQNLKVMFASDVGLDISGVPDADVIRALSSNRKGPAGIAATLMIRGGCGYGALEGNERALADRLSKGAERVRQKR